jgi:CDP-glucose 4,6-dehydratase
VRIDKSFWSGKRVLLTGHTGFKGAWACLLLHRLGARVYGLALPELTPSLFADAQVRGILAGEHLGDISDRLATDHFVQSVNPDIVIHFAAQALVRDCYRRPCEAFQTNVMGTVNLLDALRQANNVKAVLIATTDKVYFNAEHGRPFQEGDRLGGVEPYSASKAAAEMVAAAYRASYLHRLGIATPVCRAGNVIGGGDWSLERLLPDIVRAVQSGSPLEIRNPASIRPWQSVLDALGGYFALVEHAVAEMKRGQPPADADPEDNAYNFGPELTERNVTVAEICEIVERHWPGRFTWKAERDAELIGESKLLSLDPGRAIASLGWRPRLGPEAAVRQTLEWYEAYLDGEDAAGLCRRQIEEHFGLTV